MLGRALEAVSAVLERALWLWNVLLRTFGYALLGVLAIGTYAAFAFVLAEAGLGVLVALARVLGAPPSWEGVIGPGAIGITLLVLAYAAYDCYREIVPRSDGWLVDHGRGALLAEDDLGALWSLDPGENFASRRVVEVYDTTPRPDGTRERYLLRVPPTVSTPREAIAWTFGFDDASDYRPVVEA